MFENILRKIVSSQQDLARGLSLLYLSHLIDWKKYEEKDGLATTEVPGKVTAGALMRAKLNRSFFTVTQL